MFLLTKRICNMCLSRRYKSSPKRWINLLKYYYMSVLYHRAKENVVGDALRHFLIGSVSHL